MTMIQVFIPMTQMRVGIDPICYWHPLLLQLLVLNVILLIILFLHPIPSLTYNPLLSSPIIPVDTQIDLPSSFPLSAGKYWLVCTFNRFCQIPKGKMEGFCTRNYRYKATACGVMPPCFWQGKRSIHHASIYLSVHLYLTAYNIYFTIAIDNNRISPSYWEI